MITAALEDIEEAERAVERERVVAYLHYVADHYEVHSDPRIALHDFAEEVNANAHWSPLVLQRLVQQEIDETSDEAIAEILRQAGCVPATEEKHNTELWH